MTTTTLSVQGDPFGTRSITTVRDISVRSLALSFVVKSMQHCKITSESDCELRPVVKGVWPDRDFAGMAECQKPRSFLSTSSETQEPAVTWTDHPADLT